MQIELKLGNYPNAMTFWDRYELKGLEVPIHSER